MKPYLTTTSKKKKTLITLEGITKFGNVTFLSKDFISLESRIACWTEISNALSSFDSLHNVQVDLKYIKAGVIELMILARMVFTNLCIFPNHQLFLKYTTVL